MINERLVGLLLSKSLTISTAESCTGGLVAKSITDIGGCSEIYMGGVVAYSNDIKIRVLGVSPSTLDAYGAVSEQTAKEMAKGVRTLCKTDIGISTTGIAGPGGGTDEKPVGTVYVGISINEECFAFNLNLDRSMSRDEIRRATVDRILSTLYDKIFQSY
ncbi:MAG: CinA family protein [Clostridia bacterium]|nr:CinA family protein [Clostridia bacterium]